MCVPVVKRYDLLRELVLSLDVSTVPVERIFVIDNGPNPFLMMKVLAASRWPVHVHIPEKRLSVAASWNWFLQNVPEERVISNDDVKFSMTSLELMLASPAELVWAKNYGFSCFCIRDSCIEKIGLFDENISPGYAYYEDEDYLQRLDRRGTQSPVAQAENVECKIEHLHSGTLQAASTEELLEHHRKFKIAQQNYMRKWNVSNEEMFGKTV